MKEHVETIDTVSFSIIIIFATMATVIVMKNLFDFPKLLGLVAGIYLSGFILFVVDGVLKKDAVRNAQFLFIISIGIAVIASYSTYLSFM